MDEPKRTRQERFLSVNGWWPDGGLPKRDPRMDLDQHSWRPDPEPTPEEEWTPEQELELIQWQKDEDDRLEQLGWTL